MLPHVFDLQKNLFIPTLVSILSEYVGKQQDSIEKASKKCHAILKLFDFYQLEPSLVSSYML